MPVPKSTVENSPRKLLRDVVLDWAPVPGAVQGVQRRHGEGRAAHEGEAQRGHPAALAFMSLASLRSSMLRFNGER